MGSHETAGNVGPKLKAAYNLLHSKTKYVFSRTKQSDGKAIFFNANIQERVQEIVRQPGDNIWFYRGSKLVTTFINLGLIDVYNLAVHRVILGQGKPLVENIRERHKLKLLDMQGSKSGVTAQTYEAVK